MGMSKVKGYWGSRVRWCLTKVTREGRVVKCLLGLPGGVHLGGILSSVTERSWVRLVTWGEEVEGIASWGCYCILVLLGEVFVPSSSTTKYPYHIPDGKDSKFQEELQGGGGVRHPCTPISWEGGNIGGMGGGVGGTSMYPHFLGRREH